MLRADAFSEDDGLSSNVVYDIAQDKNGMLWFATANGLSRFDGKNFTVFKRNYNDENSLRYNIVSRVAVDSKNNIWIGYGAGSISCYHQDSRTFDHFDPDSTLAYSLPNGYIDEIVIDNQDRLWIGIARKGLVLFNPSLAKFQWLGMLPFVSKERNLAGQMHYNRLSQMIMGEEGKLWMATGDGFYSYDTTAKKFQVYRMEPGPENIYKWKRDVFSTICRTEKDGFYLGGWGTGLNYYNATTGKWKTYYINPDASERGTSNIINAIAIKSDHELWIGSNDTSICVFNTLDEKFYGKDVLEISQTRITNKNVHSVFTDRDGDLWIGHLSGVHFVNQRPYEFKFIPHPVTHSENKESYAITCVFDDTLSGKTFIATALADGLNVIDQKGQTKNYPIELVPGQEPFQIINKVYNDRDNNLWVLSRDFLYHFDRKNDKLLKITQPESDTSTKGPAFYWNIVTAPDGKLWIATHRHGIYVYDPTTKKFSQIFAIPGNSQSLCSNIITGMVFDTKGKVWIGYKTKGVSCYDPVSKKFIHFKNELRNRESLIDDNILSMCADKKGNVWIGSFSGLSCVETLKLPLKVNNFVKDQELLGITIVDIDTDYEGNLWFSNTKGLSTFNPKTKEIRTYNRSNGLPVFFESLFVSKGLNQEMILSTAAGYYRFNPELSKTLQQPEKVQITSLVSGGHDILFVNELETNEKIRLKASDNLFTVEFISLNFKNPGNVTYSYRLKGIDNNWKHTNRTGIASYIHLPGGNYTFEVKAQNTAGVWSEVTTVPIFIETPIYKTSWFTVLMALAVATGIFILYRWRISNIEKTEALKTEFNKQIAETEMRALRAQMNPHFIFNCLNSINRYIVKNDHKTASFYLTKFAKLIRMILDNSENHLVTLSQELEALKLYIDIEALRFDHKFSYEIDIAEGVYSDTLLVPPMIIQPFVENAIWHGLLHKESHGKMHLRFYLQDDLLVCEVEDDGIGREKAMEMKSKSATTRKSLGLKITADRIEILNEKTNSRGGITFEDIKDISGNAQGTKVNIRIPIDID